MFFKNHFNRLYMGGIPCLTMSKEKKNRIAIKWQSIIFIIIYIHRITLNLSYMNLWYTFTEFYTEWVGVGTKRPNGPTEERIKIKLKLHGERGGVGKIIFSVFKLTLSSTGKGSVWGENTQFNECSPPKRYPEVRVIYIQFH